MNNSNNEENWNNLKNTEKKHYFRIMIESMLYKNLSIIEESDNPKKEEIANKLIEDFYEEYKEQFELSCIEEVLAAIEEIKIQKFEQEHGDETER